jgi:CDGSH-type Zn-finger protein/ferredoxin
MSESNKPSITSVPDGPYIVKGLNRLINQAGPVNTEETIALCRCGKSSNKPFCDGTHAKVGFTSSNDTPNLQNKQDSYTGKKITIHDNRRICAHAGYCTDNLPNVFRMKQEPWIDADAASIEDIIATIQKCPSGALSYSIDNNNYTPDNEPSIFIAPNGPYVVSGCPDLEETVWAEGALKNKFTLCRCGASKNKPFCDGSHWSVNFRDNDEG